MARGLSGQSPADVHLPGGCRDGGQYDGEYKGTYQPLIPVSAGCGASVHDNEDRNERKTDEKRSRRGPGRTWNVHMPPGRCPGVACRVGESSVDLGRDFCIDLCNERLSYRIAVLGSQFTVDLGCCTKLVRGQRRSGHIGRIAAQQFGCGEREAGASLSMKERLRPVLAMLLVRPVLPPGDAPHSPDTRGVRWMTWSAYAYLVAGVLQLVSASGSGKLWQWLVGLGFVAASLMMFIGVFIVRRGRQPRPPLRRR